MNETNPVVLGLALLAAFFLGWLAGGGVVIWVWNEAAQIRRSLVERDADIPDGVTDHELLMCVSCPRVPGECPRCPLVGLSTVPDVGTD